MKQVGDAIATCHPPQVFGIHSKDDAEMIFQAKLLLVVAYVYQFHHDLFVRWESEPDLYNRIRDWVRGFEVNLPFLERLERAVTIATDEKTPTPRYMVTSAYPDPTESNVFWIQSLINDLGDSVKPDDFLRYLHGAP